MGNRRGSANGLDGTARSPLWVQFAAQISLVKRHSVLVCLAALRYGASRSWVLAFSAVSVTLVLLGRLHKGLTSSRGGSTRTRTGGPSWPSRKAPIQPRGRCLNWNLPVLRRPFGLTSVQGARSIRGFFTAVLSPSGRGELFLVLGAILISEQQQLKLKRNNVLPL